VFVYKNIELTAGQFSVTAAHVLGNTQAHIRAWAKLQFLVGLVKRCMDHGETTMTILVIHGAGMNMRGKVSATTWLFAG
jgi:hypothetical protein